MKIVISATVGAAVLALAVPAVAHADPDRVKFSSPSGNIRCAMAAPVDGPATVACQLENITYTVPAGVGHKDTGEPCERDYGSGRDVRLVAGQPGYIRCSYAALDGGVGPWPVLAYGRSQTLGAITCTSATTDVLCSDSSGHFFRISRDVYELG